MSVEFSGQFDITRATTGDHVKGVWVPGSTSVVPTELHWQPLSGKDLLNLPENQRSKKAIRIFSEELIQGMDELSRTPADIVSIGSTNYEIQNVKFYDVGVCDHYEAVGVEINQ